MGKGTESIRGIKIQTKTNMNALCERREENQKIHGWKLEEVGLLCMEKGTIPI